MSAFVIERIYDFSPTSIRGSASAIPLNGKNDVLVVYRDSDNHFCTTRLKQKTEPEEKVHEGLGKISSSPGMFGNDDNSRLFIAVRSESGLLTMLTSRDQGISWDKQELHVKCDGAPSGRLVNGLFHFFYNNNGIAFHLCEKIDADEGWSQPEKIAANLRAKSGVNVLQGEESAFVAAFVSEINRKSVFVLTAYKGELRKWNAPQVLFVDDLHQEPCGVESAQGKYYAAYNTKNRKLFGRRGFLEGSGLFDEGSVDFSAIEHIEDLRHGTHCTSYSHKDYEVLVGVTDRGSVSVFELREEV